MSVAFTAAIVAAAVLSISSWLIFNDEGWLLIKNASAKYPAIPLCPQHDAKSAGTLT